MSDPTPLPNPLTRPVQRACSAAVQNAHLSIPGLVIDVLNAALIHPEDPDWLARELFVLHDATVTPRRGRAASLAVWNANSKFSPTKLRYREMADNFRAMIVGEPL